MTSDPERPVRLLKTDGPRYTREALIAAIESRIEADTPAEPDSSEASDEDSDA